ncbi:WecB/TagA/CpsF family glycosyltransferase [Duganella sp. FT134W]|uniref:WecB/TagA/CpsF family glycosyltransferase n=1 Tax=Duganella margarita TaxID=2692170 RepID=A0A7X4H288_9BURK|nr:WecB/TagA/CpsF family glycosyltransferase [Duganella margarita]MYM73978.1 WecB/TagA/CpsF family glycosyltransferase [Duganella margarita]
MMHHSRQLVLRTPIDIINWNRVEEQLLAWAAHHDSRYVCLCNVHGVTMASYDPAFADILAHADLALADGAPIAWAVRHFHGAAQPRINGPDLMWRMLGALERHGRSVFLYGASPATLDALVSALRRAFPRLRVAGAIAPPFRALTAEEDAAATERINASGADLVFVGLGCPKQEFWMAAHCGRIAAPMVGVGAAFDYHAGTLRRAPLWWQTHGLEWLYRLAREPRRLARRYLVGNTLFLTKLLWQIARRQNRPHEPGAAGPL